MMMFPIIRCLSHLVLQKRHAKKKKIEEKKEDKKFKFFRLGFRDLKLETKDFKKSLS